MCSAAADGKPAPAIRDSVWDRIRHAQIEGGLRELDRLASESTRAAEAAREIFHAADIVSNRVFLTHSY